MLEDKTQSDKAPKPSLASPQSSILDFFTSPTARTKSKTASKPEESHTEESENSGSNNGKKPELIDSQESATSDCSPDESVDSVILLSEESSSLPGSQDTEADLNVSGVSSRQRKPKDLLKDKSSYEKHISRTDDVVEVSGDNVTDKESKGEVFVSETSPKSERMNHAGNDAVASDDVKKDKDKKKRKRTSSESMDRKRSKPDLDDVAGNQNCSTVMSYEDFLQSISTPSRNEMADETPPDKEVLDNQDSEVLECKKNISGDNSEQIKNNTKNRKKSARTSLFNETVEDKSDCNDLAILSGDDAEKVKKPSILNFFSKINSPSEKAPQVVTVMADIHQIPCKDLTSNAEVAPIFKPKGPKVLSPQSPELVEMENNIELLGTETIVESPKKTLTSRQKQPKKVTKKGEKTADDNKDDVQIEKVEAAPRTAEVNAFLKKSEGPSVPAKSAQATLSFTKAGLKTAATTTTATTTAPHNTRVRCEIEKSTNSTDKSKSKKTAGKKKSAKLRSTDEKKKDQNFNDSLGDETKPLKERRSRRVKYQVSSLQFDDSRQTPIKMKIRLKKNSSGEESDFTPKSSKVRGHKQQKAQKLLEKAKKVKKSKTSKSGGKRKSTSQLSDDSVIDLDSSIEGGGRRRSARIAVMSPPIPITVDEDEEDVVETAETKTTKPKKTAKTPSTLKHKDSPAKTKVKNSPLKLAKDSPRKTKIKNSPLKVAKDSPRKQKGSGKLASIFLGKSKTEPEKPKVPEDPEKVRLRQAFLMSDVPDSLKKKAIATAAVQNISDNIGLPTISHVQQKPTEEGGIWNLPVVSLPLRKLEPYHCDQHRWKDVCSDRVTPHEKSHLFKGFRCHSTLDTTVLDQLLGEVETWSKGLSVRQMYQDMKQKLNDDLRSQENTSISVTVSQPETVEEEKEKKKKGRRGRKKLSLQKEEEKKAEVEVLPVPDEKVGEMMWSERYQPTHSTEVIGHTSHIQKLKSWLLEWKHRTHKEARKMRLQMLKQSHPKSGVKGEQEDNAWWGEEDSDFDLNSDDSEEEDDSLCNTMLITGPHGVGKTATVYALAQELGYKVIEVNAASSRNGKKILSKLQEATQSHQVAASKDGGSSNMLSALSNTLSNSGMALDSPKAAKKEAKLPTAFTNLFNKASGNKDKPVEVIDLDAEELKDEKKSKRKRKRERDEEKVEKTPKKAKKEKTKPLPLPVRDDNSQSGGLELSSTTLILFDEVEIYFEDDRGYLPAIQHFMTRTKIPIILTTTEPNFGGQLQARFESLVFKQPSLVMIASHLQTICLVEQVRTCHQEMMNLVRLNGGDIRKCLLWLQYWLSSGGGSSRLLRDLKVAQRPKLVSVDENTCSQDSLSDSQGKLFSELDDNDFVMKKTRQKRTLLDDDDSSNSAVFPTSVSSSQSSRSSQLPEIHCLKLETIAGSSHTPSDILERVMLTYLRGSCGKKKAEELQELCLNLHKMGLPVVSHNLIHLLPFPKVPLNTASHIKQSSTQGRRSRIRTDLFDDEASNESSQETEEKKQEFVEPNKSTKEEKCLTYKCLTAFSDYCDLVGSLDVIGTQTETCLVSKCYSCHMAMSDSGERRIDGVAEDPDCTVMSLMQDAVVETELRSAKKLYALLQGAAEKYRTASGQQSLPEEVFLPLSGGRPSFSLMTSEPKISGMTRRAQENVTDSLPPMMHCSQRLINLDYLPSLRAMSRAEQFRQVAKAKRRFHHYFDNIGLGLKESTLNVLSQTFH